MSVGLFITEKDAKNYTTKAFINKKKSKDKFTAKPFVSGLTFFFCRRKKLYLNNFNTLKQVSNCYFCCRKSYMKIGKQNPISSLI